MLRTLFFLNLPPSHDFKVLIFSARRTEFLLALKCVQGKFLPVLDMINSIPRHGESQVNSIRSVLI